MSASTEETATATGAGSTAAAVVETPKGFPEAASRVVDAFTPTSTIRVSFGDKNVEEGTEVTPTEAQVLPTITIEGDKDKLYTVILSDPDAPSVAGMLDVMLCAASKVDTKWDGLGVLVF